MENYIKNLFRKKRHVCGYTIIELSIVLLVGAMISLLVYDALINNKDSKRYQLTVQKMDRVEIKLLEFLSENGRLPCPAAPTLERDDEEYGHEAIILSGSPARCSTSNGIKNLSDGITENYQGAVPVYTLGLRGDDIADEYGNQFSYVVTRSYINNDITNPSCSSSPILKPGDALGNSAICFAAERGAVNLHSNFLRLYGVYKPYLEGGNLIQGVSYILISYGLNNGGAFFRYADSNFDRVELDDDTPKSTYLNLGCDSSGSCSNGTLLNGNQFVVNSSREDGKIYDDIARFGARNNMVVECNQKFDGKCRNDWNLDVR